MDLPLTVPDAVASTGNAPPLHLLTPDWSRGSLLYMSTESEWLPEVPSRPNPVRLTSSISLWVLSHSCNCKLACVFDSLMSAFSTRLWVLPDRHNALHTAVCHTVGSHATPPCLVGVFMNSVAVNIIEHIFCSTSIYISLYVTLHLHFYFS